MHLTKEQWEPLIGKPDFEDQLVLALRTDGYFLLEEAFSAEKTDQLFSAFKMLLDHFRETNESNRGKNRYNLALPPQSPFIDEDVIVGNPAYDVLQRVLGDDLAVSFLAADTPLEGSDYQNAHADGRMLFPKLGISLPAYCLVMNILLVDFTKENGPLEIWPNGSHLFDGSEAMIGTEHRAPEQVIAPAGSLLVRDHRMWHRGSPNRTPDMRPMMAVVYSKSWYRFGEAEVGTLPVHLSEEQYLGWTDEMQKVFRFANVDGASNAPVVLDTLVTRIPPPAKVM